MHFADPLNITCPKCGEQDRYPLRSVKNFTAVCTCCGASLQHAGENINRLQQKVDNAVYLAGWLLHLEEVMAVSFGEENFEGIETQTVAVAFEQVWQKLNQLEPGRYTVDDVADRTMIYLGITAEELNQEQRMVELLKAGDK